MKRNSNLAPRAKLKNRIVAEYQPTKIKISEKQFWIMMIAVIIHTILLMVLFIFTLFDNAEQRSDSNVTSEMIASLETVFIRTIIVYIMNNIIDFVFVAYIFFARNKIKIGYVFTIIWFIVWTLIAVGTFFIYIKILSVLIINLILCTTLIFTLGWLFYNLYLRRQEINYETLKRRKTL